MQKVSVLVIAHNEEKYIRHCLAQQGESLLNLLKGTTDIKL